MGKIAQVPIGEKFLGSGHFLTKLTGVSALTSSILGIAIAIASIILIFLFIFGGISMIAGAGTSNPEQAAKGRQAATSAVIGFIVVFAAYWIIQLIQALTGFELL